MGRLSEQIIALKGNRTESDARILSSLAFMEENQTDLEQEVVDLHTELTRLAEEKERLAVQNEFLEQRLQRSESNSGARHPHTHSHMPSPLITHEARAVWGQIYL